MSTFRTYCLETLTKEDEKIDMQLMEDFISLPETQEQFPISITKLVEWGVDSREDNALARLNRTFTLDVDFSRTLEKSSGKGRPKMLTNLSINCFKMLCIQAQNGKGRVPLQYISVVERLWNEYTRTQFKSIQEEKTQLLNQLQDVQKTRRDIQTKYDREYGRRHHAQIVHRGPTFYIIDSGEQYVDGKLRVKIGICGCKSKISDSTKLQSLDTRLANHRVLWPNLRVRFIVYSEDAPNIEKMMKRTYRSKTVFTSREVIIGIPINDIIQTCRSILQLFDMHEEKSTFRIEERLELFNPESDSEDSEDSKTTQIHQVPVPNTESSKSDTSITNKSIEEDKSDTVEIKHEEFTTTQIQSFLDDLPKLRVNGIKTLCRKFRIPFNKRRKDILKKELQTLFQKALGQIPDNQSEENENKIPEPILVSYDPENLPRGISLCRKDSKTVGLKMTLGLGGSTYEATFRDSSKSMSDRFQEAVQLRQDLINEFNLTGSVNWDNYKRQTVVRLGICVDCGDEVSKTSSLCQSCSSKHDSAAPPRDLLLAMLREHKGNLSAVGRQLNRTDAAVRKWLIGYGFTREEIKTRSFL